MKRLQALSPVDAQFWPTMHELIGEIRHHVADEENDLFPKLRAACSEERLQERSLGARTRRGVGRLPRRGGCSVVEQ